MMGLLCRGTPVLTTLDLPTFDPLSSTLSSTHGAGGLSSATDSTSFLPTGDAAPLTSSSSDDGSGKGSSWDPAKVIAPTVIIAVLLAALVLWWLIRRERKKNVERERMVEEKAQMFGKEYGRVLRERMMAIDPEKVGRDGDGEVGVAEREVGKDDGRNGILRKEGRSPVSSLTDSLGSGRGGSGSGSGSGQLTALPSGTVDVREKEHDGGIGWRTFRGGKEIKSYQPSARKGDG